MRQERAAAHGSWPSPITSDLIASATIRLGDLALDGGDVYWSESRPAEGGRSAMVGRAADGQTAALIAPPFNARTRVHEYGGGAFAVADGTVYFSNFDDQRLYRVRSGEAPRAVTPAGPWRYADGIVDRQRNRLICVLEDHSAEGREPVNCVAAVDLATGQHRLLVSRADFYSNPRLSPDGRRLAWLAWHHPNMPWDGCELWIGELEEDGSVGYQERVAGGPSESIYQPEWSPARGLHLVSDRSGWGNLFRRCRRVGRRRTVPASSWTRGRLGSPPETGLPARGFYSAPRNRDGVGRAGGRPPLLVKSHGGPTGSTSTVLSPTIQYWTSRGIAVLD